MTKKRGNTKKAAKAKKARTKSGVEDKRAALAAAIAQATMTARFVDVLREEVRDEVSRMPSVGSRWKKHPAFLYVIKGPAKTCVEDNPSWVYIGFAWTDAGKGMPQMLAILEQPGATNGPYSDPLRKALAMDELLVEWVPAEEPSP